MSRMNILNAAALLTAATLAADETRTLDVTSDQTIDVASGTTTTVTRLTGFPARDCRRAKVKILAASATEESARGWNAIGLNRGKATPALEKDGLCATFASPGSSTIVHRGWRIAVGVVQPVVLVQGV